MDYSIGKLAELTGIPVKTIRFYSDAGVLPAPERTAAGYRRFTDEHRAHLELVRTLREIGVDLATIRSLGHRELRDVLALHLRAVETQISALQRTRAVLRATLAKDAPADEDLRRLHALGKLGAAEMGALLDEFIDDVAGDVRPRYEWLAAPHAARTARGAHDGAARRLAGTRRDVRRRGLPAAAARAERGFLGPPRRRGGPPEGVRRGHGGGARGRRAGHRARLARGAARARPRARPVRTDPRGAAAHVRRARPPGRARVAARRDRPGRRVRPAPRQGAGTPGPGGPASPLVTARRRA
jgi:DNA-binding transcriptional MerR regulator